MHHMLVQRAPSLVLRMGADRHVRIIEHAPDAEHLEPLGRVGLDKEGVAGASPALLLRRRGGTWHAASSCSPCASRRARLPAPLPPTYGIPAVYPATNG